MVNASAGGTQEEELVHQVQEHLEQCREIAVDVKVKAPEVKTVTVTAAVRTAEGADGQKVKAAVEEAVRGFFSGERLSEDISVGQLYQLLLAQPGVKTCTITAPAADVPVGKGTLPQLGNLTVEVTA